MPGIQYSDSSFEHFGRELGDQTVARDYVRAQPGSYYTLNKVEEAEPEADPYDRLADYIIARHGERVVAFARSSGIDLSDDEVFSEVVEHVALVRLERHVARY